MCVYVCVCMCERAHMAVRTLLYLCTMEVMMTVVTFMREVLHKETIV